MSNSGPVNYVEYVEYVMMGGTLLIDIEDADYPVDDFEYPENYTSVDIYFMGHIDDRLVMVFGADGSYHMTDEFGVSMDGKSKVSFLLY